MRRWVRNLLKVMSFVICTIPPAMATLHYFPLWYSENRFEIVLPTAAVICFCFCALPLIKWIVKKIKTPSAWMAWLGMFLVLYGLERIIAQMIIISGIGAISNTIGAVLWKIASKGEKEA